MHVDLIGPKVGCLKPLVGRSQFRSGLLVISLIGCCKHADCSTYRDVVQSDSVDYHVADLMFLHGSHE